jgi:hypothetical protein
MKNVSTTIAVLKYWPYLSPCFMNRIHPLDIAWGEGWWIQVTQWLGHYMRLLNIRWIRAVVDCLSVPVEAPQPY